MLTIPDLIDVSRFLIRVIRGNLRLSFSARKSAANFLPPAEDFRTVDPRLVPPVTNKSREKFQ